VEAQLIVNLLFNGMVLAGVYILVAVGLALVMGTTDLLNLAHADFYMLGAMVAAEIYTVAHYGNQLNWLLGILIALIIAGAFGGLCYWLVFKPVGNDFLAVLVTSLAVGMILVQGSILVFGEKDIFLQNPIPGTLSIFAAQITLLKIVVVVLALATMMGLFLLLKTKVGKAMRAIGENPINPVAALLQGVDAGRIFLISMIIGCGLAGATGGIVIALFGADPHMGEYILLKVLLIVMVGGFGSIKGAILVGFVMGMAESLGYHFVGPNYIIILLAIVGLLTYLRPAGLFGRVPEI